ncbi:MAG: lipid A export permease/ATP-binding protein MsbA [Pseudomonadota bacterium]|nr:lipid A export permease/ATP-binding protein MsbA [Pseudomonadota bacterium]HJO35164.1 lipid A export permease/ATP-binding protein MsbA [Gammaproteobacteria bacterium]
MAGAAKDTSSWVLWGRLLSYSRPYWPVLAIGFAAMGGFAMAEIGFAWIMKPLLDGSFVRRDPAVIRIIPFAVLGLFLLRSLSQFVSTYCMAYVGQNVIKTLREELFGHLLRLPAPYYDRSASGKLLSKLTYNVDQVAQAATQSVTVIIRDGLKVIGFVGLLFYLNAALAVFTLLIGPLIAVCIRYISRRFRRISARIQNSMGEVTSVCEEAIRGQRMVKAFGAERYEQAQFERVNERNRKLFMKRATTRAASSPVVEMVAAVPVAGIIYMATRQNVLETMTPGTFAAFLTAMVSMLGPLRQLTTVNAQLQRGLAAAESIFALLEVQPERDVGTVGIARARGEIRFEQVRMRYPQSEAWALDGVSLAIEPQQRVALVGRSGSGKSTLVNLLPRFYEPTEGRVLLDGHDLRDYRLEALRRQISLVSQEITLFNNTVAANIAYGASGAVSEAELIEAARAAHAWEFISQLPQGLQTQVGQHGVLLSGGQRQRLAIARALLKDAPILILDEATSALDTEAERHIQAALERLMADRTTLVIAHRLSTIEHADTIVVMHAGRIVEQGSHAELLSRGGHYAELHRLQFTEPQAVVDAANRD